MPTGIQPSPDKVLQGSLVAHLDSQYYRLIGSNQSLQLFTWLLYANRLEVNFNQLPVNRKLYKVIDNSFRDGRMNFNNSGGIDESKFKESAFNLGSVIVDRYEQPSADFTHYSGSKSVNLRLHIV